MVTYLVPTAPRARNMLSARRWESIYQESPQMSKKHFIALAKSLCACRPVMTAGISSASYRLLADQWQKDVFAIADILSDTFDLRTFVEACNAPKLVVSHEDSIEREARGDNAR